jgi:hypothetical protein
MPRRRNRRLDCAPLPCRIADHERQHLKHGESRLQEWKLHFEGVLGSMRRVGVGEERQVGNPAQTLSIHRHATERGGEGLDRWCSNPAHGHVMGRADQDDARRRLRARVCVANAAAAILPE